MTKIDRIIELIFNERIKERKKNQYLTVNLLLENFSVYHPVGVEENGAQHEPGPLLVLEVDRLADNSKAGRHNEHDDGEV